MKKVILTAAAFALASAGTVFGQEVTTTSTYTTKSGNVVFVSDAESRPRPDGILKAKVVGGLECTGPCSGGSGGEDR